MTRPCTKRWNRIQRLCTDYIRQYEPAVYDMFRQRAEEEFPPGHTGRPGRDESPAGEIVRFPPKRMNI